MVYILENVDTGETAVLGVNGCYTLGRSQINNILLRNTSCTRKHAIIEIKAGYATISDLGSKRGTSINKVKIQDESKLRNGDIILFGLKDCVYRFIDPQFYIVIDEKIPENIKLTLQDTLTELDVTILDNYSQKCSYYVTENITLDTLQNSKVLDAVLDQKPIVTPKFWFDMFNNIKEGVPIPNRYKYTPEIEDSLQEKGLQYIIPKINRKQLFLDKRCIFFEPGLEKRLENLLKKCGVRTIQYIDQSDLALPLPEGRNFLETILITDEKITLRLTKFIDKLRQQNKTVQHMSEEEIYVAVLKGCLDIESTDDVRTKKKAVEKEIAICSDSSNKGEQPTTSKKSRIGLLKQRQSIKITRPAPPTSSRWVWKSKKPNTTLNPGGSKDLNAGVDMSLNTKDKNVDKTNKESKNDADESKFDTSLSMSSSSDEEINIKEKELPKNSHKSPVRISIEDYDPIGSPPIKAEEKEETLAQENNSQFVSLQGESVCILDLPDSPIINVDSESEEQLPELTPPQEREPEKTNGQHPQIKDKSTNISKSPDTFQRKTKQSRPFDDTAYCILDDEDGEELLNPVSKKVKLNSDSDETALSLDDDPKAHRKKLKFNPFATPYTGSSTSKSKKNVEAPNIQQLNKMFTDVDFLPM